MNKIPRWVQCVGAVTVLIYLFRGLYPWIISDREMVCLTPDDAYYYFQVARSLAAGAGSTFDGINSTNGYHPLWMIVCTVVAYFFSPGDSPLSALGLQARALLTIQWAAAVTGLALFVRSALPRLQSPHAWGLIGAALGLPVLVYAATDGLESGLVVLGLGTLTAKLLEGDPFQPRVASKDLELGCLLAILFLCRLDLAFLSVAFAVLATGKLLTGQLTVREWFAKGLLSGAPVVATVFIYVAINHATSGIGTPISGKLKSSFPNPGWNPAHFHYLLLGFSSFLVTVVALLLRPAEPIRPVLAMGLFFQFIHLVYTAAFMEWGVYTWHFTGYWLFGVLAAGAVVDRLASHRFIIWLVPAFSVALVAVSIAAQWNFLHGRSDRAFQAQSHDAALWARENLPDASTMGMSDCGVFGYWRGGGVVNLDGLINNDNLQRTVAEEGLSAYLEQQGIRFIAHHAIPAARIAPGQPPYRYTRASRLYEQQADASLLLPNSTIVYRGPAFNDGGGEKLFVIWRVVAPRRADGRANLLE